MLLSVRNLDSGGGQELACIFNVAATGTKWIQRILEFIFELMFMEVTKAKS